MWRIVETVTGTTPSLVLLLAVALVLSACGRGEEEVVLHIRAEGMVQSLGIT